MSKIKLTDLEIKDLIKLYQSELSKLDFKVQKTLETIEDLRSRVSSPDSLSKRGPGRPRKTEVEAVTTPPKKRGRPRKSEVEAVTTPPKKRGRPRKTEVEAVTTPPKKRGRPRKTEVEAVTIPPRKRGRPRKTEIEAVTTPPKKRGRPRKVVNIPRPIGKTLTSQTMSNLEGKKKRIRIVDGGYKLSEWDQFIINSLQNKKKTLINTELLTLAQKKAKKEGRSFDSDYAKGKLNRSLHKMANKRGDIIKTRYDGKGFAYGLPEWFDKEKSLKNKYKR